MQDYQSAAVNDHSIFLVTAEMGGAGGPAYNHIVFRNARGQDAMTLHSMPMQRHDGTRTLRCVMAPAGSQELSAVHFNIVSRIEIFKGNGEAYLRKLLCAADAMKFINTQNLNYDPQDGRGDSPNSVAHTLVVAMGLEFPQDGLQFWAPGHERILVPTHWRSAYVN